MERDEKNKAHTRLNKKQIRQHHPPNLDLCITASQESHKELFGLDEFEFWRPCVECVTKGHCGDNCKDVTAPCSLIKTHGGRVEGPRTAYTQLFHFHLPINSDGTASINAVLD